MLDNAQSQQNVLVKSTTTLVKRQSTHKKTQFNSGLLPFLSIHCAYMVVELWKLSKAAVLGGLVFLKENSSSKFEHNLNCDVFTPNHVKRQHLRSKNAKNIRSVSRAKLLDKYRFQRDSQVLNARAARVALNSYVYQSCNHISNYFNRETCVKRI